MAFPKYLRFQCLETDVVVVVDLRFVAKSCSWLINTWTICSAVIMASCSTSTAPLTPRLRSFKESSGRSGESSNESKAFSKLSSSHVSWESCRRFGGNVTTSPNLARWKMGANHARRKGLLIASVEVLRRTGGGVTSRFKVRGERWSLLEVSVQALRFVMGS